MHELAKFRRVRGGGGMDIFLKGCIFGSLFVCVCVYCMIEGY